MLDTSTEGGTARRRSTFYVPLSNTAPTTPAGTPPAVRSERGAFSPFRRALKPRTPPIQEESPRRGFTPSRHASCQQLHQKVERTPVRISQLQQPQKPRTFNPCQLTKSSSASVPVLTADLHADSRTQSLEALHRPLVPTRVAPRVPVVVVEQEEPVADGSSSQPTDEDAGIHSGVWALINFRLSSYRLQLSLG